MRMPVVIADRSGQTPLVGLRVAKMVIDDLQGIIDTKRFGNEIIHARFQAGLSVAFAGIGGECDDRRAGL